MSNITELIKLQIDKMPSWNIKSYNLSGYDASEYTYTFGQQLLYVMEPDYDTVALATSYINDMVEGNSLSELSLN